MPSGQTVIDMLFADPDVQRMLTLSALWEPLSICYPREVEMTRFLRWLLDPSEGHGLGDQALKALLVRAGQDERAKELSLPQRRFLAPSQVHTSSFSSAFVAAEVDVGIKNSRLLDVLIIDPSARFYVAVENKFGGREGGDQTKDYHAGLRKMFPLFDGYHIYVDWSARQPLHNQWLKVDYDWLEEFLRSAEQRESTSAQLRTALAQFRSAIEREDGSSAESSVLGTLVTQVASRHAQALEMMKEAATRLPGRQQRARALADLVGVNDAQSKLALRLFQLYSRRPDVWDRCFSVNHKFTDFVEKLRKNFNDVRVEPQRVRAHFSLGDWERFVQDSSGHYYWPGVVSVRQTGDRWRVRSYLQLASVKQEKKDALLRMAGPRRKESGIHKDAGSEQNYVLLHRAEDLTGSEAVDIIEQQMRRLKNDLDAII